MDCLSCDTSCFDAAVRWDQTNYSNLSWDSTRNCGLEISPQMPPKFRFGYYSNLCRLCIYVFFLYICIFYLDLLLWCIYVWIDVFWFVWLNPPISASIGPFSIELSLRQEMAAPGHVDGRKELTPCSFGPNFSSYIGLKKHRVGPLLIWFMSVFLGNNTRQLFGMIPNSIWSTCHEIEVTKMTNLIIYLAVGS